MHVDPVIHELNCLEKKNLSNTLIKRYESLIVDTQMV